MDEADPLAVGVLGDEQIAVRRLVFQVPQQVPADAIDAFVPAAPRWQGEVHETRHQREHEIVIVFGQANQQGRVSHGRRSAAG